ncbi:MAG: hypothetical protein ACUVXA_19620 [Candidatus Jordarchaeum sp.]|uniref:hypothetical protein n=1 Tax=Candidatus Jordarchaeum sp. TaxID=2823881 RepID=UPI00404A2D84
MPSKFVQCYSRYIEFCYKFFNRILLKGYIPWIQRENGMVYFLKEIRGIKCIGTEALRNLTRGFIQRVERYAEENLSVEDANGLNRICSKLNDDPLWGFADRWIYQFVPILSKEREAWLLLPIL